MKRLSKVVNIVPVIAKADTLTLEERVYFKQRVGFTASTQPLPVKGCIGLTGACPFLGVDDRRVSFSPSQHVSSFGGAPSLCGCRGSPVSSRLSGVWERVDQVCLAVHLSGFLLLCCDPGHCCVDDR